MTTRASRRELTRDDWLLLAGASAGAGLGVALVVGYFGRLFLQKVAFPEPGSMPAAQPHGG